MFWCISKFDIKVEDNREDIDIPLEDRQQKDEAQEAEFQDIVPNPISNYEESDSEENDSEENNGEEGNTLPQPSKHALRKRRIILVEKHTDDKALPGTGDQASRRVWAWLGRKDDGFDYY
ncbi:hypothetical protein TSTA_127060 [Talaromyces stipitatus ATCC 10500]|uniref:Uncharacterized protein n=1 Tax=Talaromyces stipitatus (strain ATCC 10500 / CBS 375.48 / QM 6759 / NRRL 1006) TaxID=441959 RepID=B8MCU6_TALSN|nr:uncharacterized protein TSTA_127060 [Talaromyces stipitatus ATCC 10500]EED18998.1 hypothetical protein TSTA_127060 [Talaromyces stipitatus ATCC 10500]